MGATTGAIIGNSSENTLSGSLNADSAVGNNGILDRDGLTPDERAMIMKGLPLDAQSSIGMFVQYVKGDGRTVSLSEMKLDNAVKRSVVKENAFGIKGTIQDRFINNQIVKGDNYFKRVYNFGSETIWAMGDGVLSGEFVGNVTKNPNGTYHVKGVIKYEFSDRFEDPYDTFNWWKGSIDIGGTPYDVREKWEVNIDGIYKGKEKD